MPYETPGTTSPTIGGPKLYEEETPLPQHSAHKVTARSLPFSLKDSEQTELTRYDEVNTFTLIKQELRITVSSDAVF